ncbi:MAG: lipopolysaccharide kinase InaA family protein [Planctomycetota bacterium]|jgi:heptose I phosphotransferase
MNTTPFTSHESARGKVHVNPAYGTAVEALSLTRFADAMGYIGGEVVDSNRKRSVVRIEWAGSQFFLKRFTRPPAKDAISRWFGGGGWKTHGAVECEMAHSLKEIGIGAPEIAAYGEENGFGPRRRSFVLTPEIPHATPLWRVLDEASNRFRGPRARGEFIARVARTVRTMHEGGITHPDLYGYHIFLVEGGTEPAFAFIDLHRVERKKQVTLYDAVRDLTGLHLSLPPSLASRTDRVRFLIHYFRGKGLCAPAKKLASKILRRSKRIGGRKRFREEALRNR